MIVGEASGDLHGARLISHIKLLYPGVCFRGLGGYKMVREGFFSIEKIERLSVMGFAEVFKSLFFFKRLQKRVLKDVVFCSPKKIILIDYPGFNLRIAKKIKTFYTGPIIYYISPQLWAWKENRLVYIKKYIDHMIVVFPFEVDWYMKRGIYVDYFGHPVVELYKQFFLTFKNKPFQKNNFVVSLFPGSRKQELKNHLPLFKNVIKILQQKIKNIYFIVGLAPGCNINLKKDLGLSAANSCLEKENSFAAFCACWALLSAEIPLTFEISSGIKIAYYLFILTITKLSLLG